MYLTYSGIVSTLRWSHYVDTKVVIRQNASEFQKSGQIQVRVHTRWLGKVPLNSWYRVSY